jgi:hypothetical protein
MCAGVETTGFTTEVTIVDNQFINVKNIGINCGGVAIAFIEQNRFDQCDVAIQSITGRSVVVRQKLSVGHRWCISLFNVIDWVIENNTIDDGVQAVACSCRAGW